MNDETNTKVNVPVLKGYNADGEAIFGTRPATPEEAEVFITEDSADHVVEG